MSFLGRKRKFPFFVNVDSVFTKENAHMTNAAEIENLSKDYGKLHALNNIMLNVPEGTIHGLIGPNGAGKTTLIKALVGAVKPTAGSIKVLGFERSCSCLSFRLNTWNFAWKAYSGLHCPGQATQRQ